MNEEKEYKTLEEFVDDCEKEGMNNFFVFAGDGIAKRACVGAGNEEDTLVSIAACFLDRPDIRQMFQTAIRLSYEIENEDKNIN